MKKGALISLDRDTAEIEELCRSADIDLLYAVMQRRSRPDQTYYLGRGRFNELKELLVESPVDVVVINGELKPSQHFNLENGLKTECLDRIAVVLDIFTSRAEGRESKPPGGAGQVALSGSFDERVGAQRQGRGAPRVPGRWGVPGRRVLQPDTPQDSSDRGGAAVPGPDGDLRRGVRRYKGFRTVCLAGYTNAVNRH